MSDRASNWSDAMRVKRLMEIICPKCFNGNSPGKIMIDIEDDGSANCGFCSHVWNPKED